MKQALTLALSVALFSTALCQQSHLTISNDFKIVEKEYQDQTITNSIYHNNFFYTVTNSGFSAKKWLFTKLYDLVYSMTVSKYDKNMSKIKEYAIASGEKQFGPLMPQLVLVNNKLALAYFQPDANKSSFSFYMALVDEGDLSLKNPQKFCTVRQDNVNITRAESVLKAGLVSFAYSPDKTKTLVVCVTNPNMMQTYVIDNELHIVKQSDLRTATGGFTVSSAALSNDNTECIVLSAEDGIKIVANSADKRKNEMKLSGAGNLKPYLTKAIASKDGKTIYLSSSGTDASSEDKNCTGFLIYQLDCGTMHLSRPFAYSFTPEQIQTFCENGAGARHKKEYSMFPFMPAITELDNGNIVVLGCPQQVTTSVHTSFSAADMNNNTGHQVAETKMDVGPIMAFYPGKTGKNFDYALIPRHINVANSASSGSGNLQIIQAPGITQAYSGFISVNLGDKVMVIYNDNPDNVNSKDNSKIVKANSAKDLVLAEGMFGADEKLQYKKQIGEDLPGRG
ncbi:MAG: hypothetical protein JST13_09985, partial [Bacteroidetes bacterium]|nr:hypothetical protein [Bacteroidota bacterium]